MHCDAGSGIRRSFDYWFIRVLRHPMSPPARRVLLSVCRTLLPMMRFYGQTSQLTGRISSPRPFCCSWTYSWLAFCLLFSLLLIAPVYLPWNAPLSGCLRKHIVDSPSAQVRASGPGVTAWIRRGTDCQADEPYNSERRN